MKKEAYSCVVFLMVGFATAGEEMDKRKNNLRRMEKNWTPCGPRDPARTATITRATGNPTSHVWTHNYMGDMYKVRFGLRHYTKASQYTWNITLADGRSAIEIPYDVGYLTRGYRQDGFVVRHSIRQDQALYTYITVTLGAADPLGFEFDGARVEFIADGRRCSVLRTIFVRPCPACSDRHLYSSHPKPHCTSYKCPVTFSCASGFFGYTLPAVCRESALWNISCPACHVSPHLKLTGRAAQLDMDKVGSNVGVSWKWQRWINLFTGVVLSAAAVYLLFVYCAYFHD